MVWNKHDYDDIPGTYVFDGKRSHSAYALNKLLFSFIDEKNRQAFNQDPGAYADKYGLPAHHREMLVNFDFLGMLRNGANIYYLAKLALPKGVSIQDAGAAFHQITTAEFQAKLDQKAAGFTEKLEKLGGYWNG